MQNLDDLMGFHFSIPLNERLGHNVDMNLFQTFIELFLSLFISISFADKKEGVTLSNSVDASITIHKISFLPTVDNVDGIFSRPFDAKMNELLQADHQWLYTPAQFTGGLVSPADLIKSPTRAIKISQSLKADALIITEVRKNPKDFVLALYLFSALDGKLISHVAATDLAQDSTEKALKQFELLFQQLKYRIPYDGMVLSRTKNRVTLNLGALDGLTPGQELACSKIIEIKRHPKLGHIIQHEKVLIGKIKLVKVDPKLSFGDIVSETEAGSIQKDAKITGARPVQYLAEKWIKDDYVPAELLLSENNKVNGKIQEWKPEMPPSFGLIGASFGLSNYQQTLSLANTTLTAKNSIYPTVSLYGEMWINPEWFVNVGLSQGTGTIENPVAGGSPGKLSLASGFYSLDVGYNILLRDDFFDSKIFAALGYMNYSMDVDTSSGNGLNSTEYSGFRLLLGGKTPLDIANRWYLGATLQWYLHTSYKEKPFSSGADDSKIVNFRFLLDYRWSERVVLNSSLDFATYMVDFNGGGNRPVSATKGSERFQTLNVGASYMF
jgi:hypothetical protein